MKEKKPKKRCKGMTRMGRRCTINAQFRGYCIQHISQEKEEKKK